jgi:serine/threonine protein kinase
MLLPGCVLLLVFRFLDLWALRSCQRAAAYWGTLMGTDRYLTAYLRSDIEALYIIHGLLGSGANGVVHRATRRLDNAPVAIKVLHSAEPRPPTEIATLRRISRASDHPNVVRCVDLHASCREGTAWVVMELLPFGPLTRLLEHAHRLALPLQESVIARVCHCVAKALRHLHGTVRLLHGDVKSDNVLLGLDGSVKLGDYGSSREARARDRRGRPTGTVHWMAPEVIDSSRGYDAKADIWSLGAVALELATGLPPHGCLPAAEAAVAILRRPAPCLRPDAWSYNFCDFVAGCLQKVPSQRPDSQRILRHSFLSAACTPSSLASLLGSI